MSYNRSPLSFRAHLATRILQLDRELSQPPLKGARRPSPDGILRASLLRERTHLTIKLRNSFPTPTRITRALLIKLAYNSHIDDIILSCPPATASTPRPRS